MILIAIYLAYIGIFLILQRSIIYPGQYLAAPPDVAQTIPGLERWWLETDQGLVEAWFMPTPQASATQPAPIIIYAHGNGELIDYWPQSLTLFLEQGLSLLLVEYPGYGRSAGRPSQKSITRAMVAAYDRLLATPIVDPARIIIYGRSLGGGAACALAAKHPPAALILQSTFTSIRQMALRHWIPGFLVQDSFDNASVVQGYLGPTLIIHGVKDEVIPFSHGERLAQIALQATFITSPCGHNDCPPGTPPNETKVLTFLRQANILN